MGTPTEEITSVFLWLYDRVFLSQNIPKTLDPDFIRQSLISGNAKKRKPHFIAELSYTTDLCYLW